MRDPMNDDHPAPSRQPWMIYGANGYTGSLIAREAVKRGLSPLLAGRNRHAVQALAGELGLESRVFALDDSAQVARELGGLALVLHCAGPFSATAEVMMRACIQARAHYLDITGEIAVLELAQTLGAQAAAAGVVLCPGVGFDVIPTDCVAAALKAALPDATHLALGFDSGSGMSAGTAKTTVEGLVQGGKVRRDGRIVDVPLACKVRRIDFGDGLKASMTIPWGDVATAFHTTGIPNIEVYMPGSPALIAAARCAYLIRPLLRLSCVQRWIKARIDRAVSGPSDKSREQMPTYVWGEAINSRGETRVARIRTANVYSLTVTGSLAAVQHLLGNAPAGGACTPSRLMGQDLVTRLPGSGALHIE